MRGTRGGHAARALVTLLVVGPALAACGINGGGETPAPEHRAAVAAPDDAKLSAPTARPTASGRPGAEARGARPNILVIEADDMRADELDWMPRTQRLLGRAGLRFENSFAPNPLCCPSRASFLTGKLSHHHGVLSHEEPYGFGAFDDSDTLATRLQAVGYRTALVGKYLNGYGTQSVHGSGEDSLTYVPPGWTEWWAGSDHIWRPGDPYEGGTYNYFNLTSNVNGSIRTWPGEYTTAVTGRQTRDLVRRFDGATPWFVWWNPVAPHHGSPVEPDDPGTTLRSDGFPVEWATPARPEWVKGAFDGRIPRGLGVPAQPLPRSENDDKPGYLRSLPALTATEREALRTVSRQRAESLLVLDREIATTMHELRRSGQAGRTVVVFTSDNGYYLGEHLKRQGKINLHEPSVRVPLFVAGPGVPVGRRYDPATTVDLSRTLAAWAGAELPAADGIDLTSVVERGDRGWTRPLVLEGLMPEARYVAARRRAIWRSDLDTIGLRVGAWKLIRYATGETELFDIAGDPLERESVSGPAGGIRARLSTLLDRYDSCTGDACSAPLPPDLVLPPQLNRQVTEHQRARQRQFYR